MTVNKLTFPSKDNEVQNKINEIIDNLGGGGVAPVWGNITGTLSNQTDLQSALNAKQDVLTSANAGNNIQISSELPNGFKQLSHIVFDGTQELDTGYICNQNTKIISKFYGTVNNSWVYGSGSSNPRVTCYLSTTGNQRFGNVAVDSTGITTNTLNTVTQDKNGFYYNNGSGKPYVGVGTFTAITSLTIGNANGSTGTPRFSGSFYYLQIFDNGKIVRDYIPAKRVSDDAVGLYDKVTYTFLTDANLTAGNVVNTTLISFTNDTGYITGITSTDVTTALGYTPYDSSNPNGYTSNTGTVTSVNNVSPVSGNVTISIPTDTSDLTNGAGYITSSSLSNLADNDLSNLSATGKTVIDGQWVFPSSVNIAQTVTYPTTDDISYSLSTYLPNDNHIYEVIFVGSVTTGSSNGDQSYLSIYTDISGYVNVCGIRTRTSASGQTGGTVILAVGTGRKINVRAVSNYTGTFNLNARGYRRIGTNS